VLLLLLSNPHHHTDSAVEWLLLLMLTMQPAFSAAGPSFLLMEPPALNSAMSTSLKLQTIGNKRAESVVPKM